MSTPTPPRAEPRFMGKRITRREDPRFLRGSGRYVDDIVRPAMLHAAFVRSVHPHGQVGAVDLTAALELDGVEAGLTGRDIAERVVPMRCDATTANWQGSEYWPLATDRVRFVGEPVACVVADSRYRAEDAAELVEVEIEPLAPVASVAAARADGAPLLHEGWRDNCFNKREFRTEGFDEVLAACAHRITRSYDLARHSGIPLETRGCIAEWDSGRELLTVWLTSQIPHLVRTGLADTLRLKESQVRVISPDVGGGFGIKFPLYPEEIVCALLAMRTGRPVKWIEDRTEHMIMANHARQHHYDVEVGFDDDGVVQALRAEVSIDCGAYSMWPVTATMEGGMAFGILPGPYRIRNYHARTFCVATTKAPIGAYRGVSRPGACFAIERTMDAVARELDLDPAEVRRRNLVRPEEFPYTSVTGLVYDSGSFIESLDAVLEHGRYGELRARQQEARAQGRYLGIGVCVYTEQTAHTFGEFKKRGIPMTFGYEATTLRMDPSGTVVLQISTHSHGQGLETTMAQVVAEELGVDIDDVRVEFGDTDKLVYGNGTFASRAAVLAGGAAHRAAGEVREKLARIAAHALEAPVEDIETAGGRAFVRGAPARGYSFAEMARWTYHNPQHLPPGEPPVIEATTTYDADPGGGTFTNAALLALVEVDVETGHVQILELEIVEDCGRMINPMIVDGQIHGGIAQGIGSALYEEFVYSEEGQPLTTTFVDYLLPGSTDVPDMGIHHLMTPSPFTINGLKGMGEGGAIGPGALLASAVEDAIRPLTDARIDRLPVTPERVRQWLQEGRRGTER